MRAAGVKVDDCPCRFNGNQAMWLSDKTFFPLVYKRGLSYLPIRKPTQEELETLVTYDIISPDWDPPKQHDKAWKFIDKNLFDDDDPNDPDNYSSNLKKQRGESKEGGGYMPLDQETVMKIKTQ